MPSSHGYRGSKDQEAGCNVFADHCSKENSLALHSTCQSVCPKCHWEEANLWLRSTAEQLAWILKTLQVWVRCVVVLVVKSPPRTLEALGWACSIT